MWECVNYNNNTNNKNNKFVAFARYYTTQKLGFWFQNPDEFVPDLDNGGWKTLRLKQKTRIRNLGTQRSGGSPR